jgi:protein SCO1/2
VCAVSELRSRPVAWLLFGLLVAPLLLACTKVADSGTPLTVGGDDDGYFGAKLTTPYDVPPVRLHDTADQPYSLSKDAKAELTLVFFGYTHCPDVCQVVMATIASALTRLDDDVRDRVDVVFVTTDPARDDAKTLRSYLDRFNPDFVGLTGPLAQVKRLGEGLKVYVARGQELPGGGYEVDHSTPIIGVRPDATAPMVWTQGTSSAQLAADIEKLVAP